MIGFKFLLETSEVAFVSAIQPKLRSILLEDYHIFVAMVTGHCEAILTDTVDVN